MALDKTYNLDEEVKESFHFTIKGHEYEFRQLTTEEIDAFQNMKGDKEIREHLYQFITPSSKDAPDFPEMAKQMLAPHWKNFIKMVRVEMGIEQ